jgi:hypothetical protein
VPIFRRFSSSRLPADVAAALPLEPGDRVLAWSPLTGGGAAAATVTGLRVLSPTGRTLAREWAQVRQAAWDGGSGTLAVTWVTGRQVTPLELTRAGRLPEVVHERVRASLLLSRQVELPGGRTAWVALRRSAGGALVSQVVPGPGARLDDPQAVEAVRRAESALWEEAGGPV